MVTNGGDQLRLAVALIALKYKRQDQTYPAYVLELRSRFPSSQPSAPTADGSWRAHAVSLEKDIVSLRTQYEAEQLRTSKLQKMVANAEIMSNNSNQSTTIITAAAAPPPPPPGSEVAPAAKRTKKKVPTLCPTPRTDPPQNNPDTVVKDFIEKNTLASDTYPSLTICLEDMRALLDATSDSTKRKQRHLLVSIGSRALKSCASLLKPMFVAIKSPEKRLAKEKLRLDIQSTETLRLLLLYIHDSILPYVMPKRGSKPTATLLNLIDRFVGQVLDDIVFPIIRAFHGFSRAYILTLLKPSSHRTNPILPDDLRPTLFSLIQGIFLKLHKLYSSDVINAGRCGVVRVPEAIALETTRQLKIILSDCSSIAARARKRRIEELQTIITISNNTHTHTTNHVERQWVEDGRLRGVAHKDSIWYLCGILHVVFSVASTPHRNEPTIGKDLLRTGIISSLTEVVSLCRSGGGSSREEKEGCCLIRIIEDGDDDDDIPESPAVADVTPSSSDDATISTRPAATTSGTVEGQLPPTTLAITWPENIEHNPVISPNNNELASSEKTTERVVAAAVVLSNSEQQQQHTTYLENLFHTGFDTLPNCSSEDNNTNNEEDEEEEEEVIFDLPDSGLTVDEVAYDMILGVVEGFWVWDTLSSS